ncbi:MAG: phage minor head protein [Limnohabitans sp.]
MDAAEAYIRALAEAVTRQEDAVADDTRRELLELVYRLRLLFLQLPSGQLERQLAYSRLRRRIYREIQYTLNRIFPTLTNALEPIELLTLDAAAALFDVTPLPSRNGAELLTQTRLRGQTLNSLFMLRVSTGTSDFAQQLFRLLDKTVQSAFLQNIPNDELANRLVQVRVRGDRRIPVLTKGTVANSFRSRFKGIVAAAFWAIAYANQQRTARLARRPIQEWRWNAVLDPKTCPVCRPLDGTTALIPDAFPQGPPPLHPYCRCVVIPLFDD